MPIVVGISLRTAGKLYYFDPGDTRFLLGERVIVETARGTEIGTVKLPPHEVTESQIVPPLKPVLRRATIADINRYSMNREREEHALTVCKRLVNTLGLPMRLIDAQYTLDGTHILMHFLADNRVDFRELVRELARELHARIELRQVGVRDEAKLIGGYGICGRKLCCASFLGDFAPVAISMAKDQGLALNPQKISGSCGRLMCCLAYECDHYRHEKAELPRLNATVETPLGVGKVTKLNVLAHQVEVTLPDSSPTWFPVDELAQFKSPGKCCGDSARSISGTKCCHHQVLPDSDVRTAKAQDHTPLAADTVTPILGMSNDTPESSRSRSRRRRKRVATTDTTAQSQPTSGTGGSTAGVKRSPRRRRSRGSQTDNPVSPVGVATVTENKVVPETHENNVPPAGRYRPRRRRRQKGSQEGNRSN